MGSLLRRSVVTLAAAASLVLPACAVDASDDDADADAVEAEQESDAITAARKVQTEKLYGEPVIARMWMPGRRAVGDKTTAEVIKALKSRSPSIVSGLIRIDDGSDLSSPEQEAAFAEFRVVRGAMKNVAFDIVLNACQYNGPEALTKRMGAINQKLGGMKPEAWFFDFYDTPLHDRDGECDARGPGAKAMLRKAAEWAHRNKQLIGGNIWSSKDPPEKADFYSVPDDHGKQATLEIVNRLPPSKQVFRLVHVENNPQNCSAKGGDPSLNDDPRRPTKPLCKNNDGDRYIWRMSPKQRQDYDSDFVSLGRKNDFTYMRPVFFPLSYHLAGGGSQAFDRDANQPASELPFVMN